MTGRNESAPPYFECEVFQPVQSRVNFLPAGAILAHSLRCGIPVLRIDRFAGVVHQAQARVVERQADVCRFRLWILKVKAYLCHVTMVEARTRYERRRAFFFLIHVPCGVPKNTPKPAQNSAQRNTKTRFEATKSDNPRKGANPVGITAAARIALTSNVVRALLLNLCLGLCRKVLFLWAWERLLKMS